MIDDKDCAEHRIQGCWFNKTWIIYLNCRIAILKILSIYVILIFKSFYYPFKILEISEIIDFFRYLKKILHIFDAFWEIRPISEYVRHILIRIGINLIIYVSQSFSGVNEINKDWLT